MKETIANTTVVKKVCRSSKNMKYWKVKPQSNEGTLVCEAKKLRKSSGITITDFVIGNGSEPKLGSSIMIVYEGMFPDGTVFDSNMKTSKPFTFRKGLREVIKGLDLGIVGMAVGDQEKYLFLPIWDMAAKVLKGFLEIKI
eukprot:CAMPEP_0201097182 /NCGR_PEP_ID=MMETSP0812-20130820/6243_1 /ASSEMBLY_ACC=CAM_ASM_000668 /TAXON_ID=98059 /ORGANISM="Dinobryon sp., Strain UTEXLB2267" /LENGTH=140 /DNA_ID=CAMNT_0047351941 /DNA_START=1 /DNA_END=424 /DNA_ORIENTATION=-